MLCFEVRVLLRRVPSYKPHHSTFFPTLSVARCEIIEVSGKRLQVVMPVSKVMISNKVFTRDLGMEI